MTDESGADDEFVPYSVILAPTAEQALKAVDSKIDRMRIDRILRVLDTVPGIGRTYDPLYDAARPDGSVLVAYAGHYGIYYEASEKDRTVYVYYLEDQRRDPLARFRN